MGVLPWQGGLCRGWMSLPWKGYFAVEGEPLPWRSSGVDDCLCREGRRWGAARWLRVKTGSRRPPAEDDSALFPRRCRELCPLPPPLFPGRKPVPAGETSSVRLSKSRAMTAAGRPGKAPWGAADGEPILMWAGGLVLKYPGPVSGRECQIGVPAALFGSAPGVFP